MSRINVANFRHPDGTSDNINLTDTGRVGVNESAPDRALHVNSGNQNECAKFESTDTEVTLEFTDTTGTAALKCRNDFRFNTSSSTEICRIESGGNFKFNSGYGSVATAYGVRAWIYFDGELASIGTGLGSAGVSSVTDHAVGEYTINFSFTFPDINYCVVTGLGDRESNNDAGYLQTHATAIQTTTTFRFRTVNYAYTTTADCEDVSLAFIR